MMVRFTKILFLICIHKSLVDLKKIHPIILYNVSIPQALADPYIPSVIKQVKSAVDIDTFRTDEVLLRKYVRSNLEETIQLKPESRRVIKQVTKKGSTLDPLYTNATNYQFRTKVLDSMLQLVYMTRHYFKQFEKYQYIDKTSINFRIGFVSRKLRMLFRKAVRIFEMLNIKQRKQKWGETESITAPLSLHHKVAKIHVDFEYYYIVIKKLHAKARPRDPPQYHQPVWQLGTID
ncbi:uncharacterized protein LOC133529736 [Cydia pomonella]|uniref:uncharacterized protein LOC133529736 n=1 Tax=Cydia pomonella TaxID=82600 RepID=UPI002ADDDADE|nr:uncharacterized protein LOC133529736 [Cydia pomonella]